MRRTLINTTLFVIFLALPQRSISQDPVERPKACGEQNIKVESISKPFKIPSSTESPFKSKDKCTYKLTSDANTVIVFKLTKLNIGYGTNCDNDYIKVADEESAITTTAYRACGNSIPGYPFRSRTNAAFIEILVTNVPQNTEVEGTLIAVPIVDPACGSNSLTLQDSTATLSIPEVGKKFSSPALCFYNIKGNDDKKLQLEITSLHLGVDGKCDEDFIKVADSQQTIQQSNYSYCGTRAPTAKFVSQTNTLFIAVASYTEFEKTSIKVTYSKVNFASNLESSTKIVFLLLALVAMR